MPAIEPTTLVQIVAWLALGVGLLGTVVPGLPGPALIWLGALAWAWADGFAQVGWGTLLLLGALALLALGIDVLASAWGARRGGASWRGLALSGLGALIGLVVLSLPGALIGAIVGLVAGEASRLGGEGGARQAWRASRGLLIGWLLSLGAQLLIGMLMVVVFTLRVWSG